MSSALLCGFGGESAEYDGSSTLSAVTTSQPKV